MSRIVVRRLEKRYGDAVVLERVSLAIEPGEFCAVVGASGCGKSTFLRILLSQEQPTSGTVTFDGRPLPPEPMPERGIVFQRYSAFPHLSALHNLLVVAELRDAPRTGRLFGAARRRALDEADAMLARVGLSHARALYPDALSGGMQQRLAIAQALLGRPRLLLLDEPFGALDPGIRAEMHGLLNEIWEEHRMTVVMVTHDIREAFTLGTRLLVFDKVRHDPQFPAAYGATITYDIRLDPNRAKRSAPPAEVVRAVRRTLPGGTQVRPRDAHEQGEVA